MAIFAVVLNEPNEELMARVKEAFAEPAHFQLADHLAFVRSPLVSAQVAEKIGLQEGGNQIGDATGVVLRVENYAGWNSRALWEWLDSGENGA